MAMRLNAAKYMGYEMSPPAYLSLSGPVNMDGFTGVNYASADAGIRNSTVSQLYSFFPF